MSVEWHYQFMGEIIGPLTAAELRKRALNGEITHDTLITRSGTKDWITADRVKGLLADATAEESAEAARNARASSGTPDSGRGRDTVAVPKNSTARTRLLTPREVTLLWGLGCTCVFVVFVILSTLARQNESQRISTTPYASTIEAPQTIPSTSSTSEDDRRREHYRAAMDALNNNTDSRKVQESLDKVDRDHGVDPNRRYR